MIYRFFGEKFDEISTDEFDLSRRGFFECSPTFLGQVAIRTSSWMFASLKNDKTNSPSVTMRGYEYKNYYINNKLIATMCKSNSKLTIKKIPNPYAKITDTYPPSAGNKRNSSKTRARKSKP